LKPSKEKKEKKKLIKFLKFKGSTLSRLKKIILAGLNIGDFEESINGW